ncbi:XdhC family protein [Paenibacillus sp. TRM 82003]|nr:XdhC family protein [Paenibacillus sp. TRM 82003]
MDASRLLTFVERNENPAVLATVVGVEGHAYRKAGAFMVFSGEGCVERLGSISPGCLESDLELRAPRVWDAAGPEVVEYDMRSTDDFSWGEAIGCGGKIEVLLEPVAGKLRDALLELGRRVGRGEEARLLRFREGGELRYVVASGLEGDGPEWFAATFAPSPRLVLFGAGLDVLPIAEAAGRAGFRIAVGDWREGLATKGRFPEAELAIGTPEEVASTLRVGASDYVLVCSHQFGRDRRFIEAVLPARPLYLGVIGSKARVRMLLGDGEPPSFVRAPAGLAIGADGPEEIAISIVAELIRMKRQGAAATQTGGMRREGGWHLLGGGAKQEDGGAEAIVRAVNG